MKWADTPALAGQRATSGSRCATTTAPGKAPARDRAQHGQRRHGARVGGADVSADLQVPLQRATCRSARLLRRRRDAGRRARSSRTRRTPYATRGDQDVLDEVLGSNAAAEPDPRAPTTRARASYGTAAPYDDARQAAALMSQLAGKPVRLQFMRWDEHGWDNYGPAAADRHPRRRRRERQHRRVRVHALRHPVLHDAADAQQQVHRRRRRSRPPAPLEHDDQRRAVQRSRTGGDRQDAAAAEQLLQDVVRCGRRTAPQTAFAAEQ